jgi:hypothetical protein
MNVFASYYGTLFGRVCGDIFNTRGKKIRRGRRWCCSKCSWRGILTSRPHRPSRHFPTRHSSQRVWQRPLQACERADGR